MQIFEGNRLNSLRYPFGLKQYLHTNFDLRNTFFGIEQKTVALLGLKASQHGQNLSQVKCLRESIVI